MAIVALAFLAGLLTILSPCVLPLAPIVVAASRANGLAGPMALAGGLAASFAVVGGALAAFGVEAGGNPLLRGAAALALALAGVALLSPALQTRIETTLAPLANLAARSGPRAPAGVLGEFMLGAALALAWAPCAGPTLGAAFALAASAGSRALGALAFAAFALGAAAALLAAGFGIGRLAGLARGRVRFAAALGRAVFGVTLIAVGLGVLTGLDHRVEALAIDVWPDWLTAAATRF